jgi:hypothetical protein
MEVERMHFLLLSPSVQNQRRAHGEVPAHARIKMPCSSRFAGNGSEASIAEGSPASRQPAILRRSRRLASALSG